MAKKFTGNVCVLIFLLLFYVFPGIIYFLIKYEDVPLIQHSPQPVYIIQQPPLVQQPHYSQPQQYLPRENKNQDSNEERNASPELFRDEKPKTAICSRCGETNKLDQKYCGYCGNQL